MLYNRAAWNPSLEYVVCLLSLCQTSKPEQVYFIAKMLLELN